MKNKIFIYFYIPIGNYCIYFKILYKLFLIKILSYFMFISNNQNN